MRRLLTIAGVAIAALACSAPARAQAAAATGARGDVEVSAGVVDSVHVHGTSTTYRGWRFEGSYRIHRVISLIGEINGEYRSATGYKPHLYSYGGGARFESANPETRVKPFAEVFMGAGEDNGMAAKSVIANTYPVFSPAGGIDLRVASRAAIRARVDFPLYMTFGPVAKGARFSIGLALPLGSR